jgi:PKD domain
MKILSYIIVLASFWPAILEGQKEADQWWIGYYDYGQAPGNSIINVDFSGDSPLFSTDYSADIFLIGTNASICTKDGEIIMTTNGMQLYSNLFGSIIDTMAYGYYWDYYAGSRPFGFPRFNAALILPLPNGLDNQYSVLYHDAELEVETSFQFTEILESRIALDHTGFPSVVYQDSVIAPYHEFYHPAISATKHANGRDWWIIIFERSSDKYHRYLLDPEGIQYKGIDSVSQFIESGLAFQNFSPSGNLYIRYDAITFDEGQYVSIFSFDRCEGKMNFLSKIHTSAGLFAGAAVSPSEQFLYVDNKDTLWQFDLLASDIQASQILIDTNRGFKWPGWIIEGFGPLVNAPDGRIYLISSNGSSHSLSVIDRPDEPGTACRFLQNGIILPTFTSRSPPNVANYRLGPMDGSECDSLGVNNLPVARWRWELQDSLDPTTVRFTDLSFYRPEVWHWDMDDGMTSDTSHPIHTYATPGLYHVCLTVSNEYATDSMCRWVEIKDITSTTETDNEPKFDVRPNPFKDYLEIIPLDDGYHLYDMTLIDIFGRIVLDQAMTFPGRIGLKTFPSGIYFLSLRQGDHVVWSTKLLKVE